MVKRLITSIRQVRRELKALRGIQADQDAGDKGVDKEGENDREEEGLVPPHERRGN